MTQQRDRDEVIVNSVLEGAESTILGGQSATTGDHVTGGFVVDLRSRRPIVFPEARSDWQLWVKRAMDVAGAAIAIVILSPILIITALAVALTSPGPVFFSQRRVGQFGTEFRFLKFRSMYVDAEARREEFEALNQHTSGPIFKIKNDPRITPVGRVIRKLSIDELPQLFHVLSGKMSLVGPRPPIPSEVATYGVREHRRLLVKPGITCIWQVSGRSELDFDTWMEMDIEYIEKWSLWLDVKLLAKTIPAVVTCRGAY